MTLSVTSDNFYPTTGINRVIIILINPLGIIACQNLRIITGYIVIRSIKLRA